VSCPNLADRSFGNHSITSQRGREKIENCDMLIVFIFLFHNSRPCKVLTVRSLAWPLCYHNIMDRKGKYTVVRKWRLNGWIMYIVHCSGQRQKRTENMKDEKRPGAGAVEKEGEWRIKCRDGR
jgi:hypothetical protein